jgi:hypothetical protein
MARKCGSGNPLAETRDSYKGTSLGLPTSPDIERLYLVIESAKLDTKHERPSTAAVPADGAGR